MGSGCGKVDVVAAAAKEIWVAGTCVCGVGAW